MEIRERIEEDMKRALKEGGEPEKGVLRLLKTALHNAEIAKRPKPLEESDVLAVLQQEVKKRREAIELFERGGRRDLAEKEEQELQVVLRYLPEEMDEEELKAVIDQSIHEIGANNLSDFGRVMGVVMEKVRGRADGKRVGEKVREALASLQR